MSASVQVSQVIDRPVDEVFRFYADEHVRNHPRWDPHMQLEQVSDGPMGVGTVIKRVNSRSGQPVRGTMEVVEYERNRSVGMVIYDGEIEIRGRATVKAEGEDRTCLTFNIELPGMDESMDTSVIASGMRQTLQNIKRLVESEI